MVWQAATQMRPLASSAVVAPCTERRRGKLDLFRGILFMFLLASQLGHVPHNGLAVAEGRDTPGQTSHQPQRRRAESVWAMLAEAAKHPVCSSPPCVEGNRIHEEWMDIGEEMSRVDGAAVVRRPELIDVGSSPTPLLSPVNSLDYVKTLQSYFPIFRDSLMMVETQEGLEELPIMQRFLDAVEEGDDSAAKYLSANYATGPAEEKLASDGYESVSAVVSMADVFINKDGYFWNDKVFVAPNSCLSTEKASLTDTRHRRDTESFGKVVVLTQEYGQAYYHLLVENLSRITVVKDLLVENPDIKIHADLAIVPPSTVCGKPNAAMVNLLRHHLLQVRARGEDFPRIQLVGRPGLYPHTGGVPPVPPRPVILLIVRVKKRGIQNNDEVREALAQNFPDFDVVEFEGIEHIRAQLGMFATASMIVGPHGAGLSNMVVSPLHTMVLEIGPIDCPACYVNLAIKLQHIYARHTGSDQGDDPCDSWYEPNVDDIVSLAR
ncbi:unnamed protein product [Ectocarpus sp. 12 AP-2014]